MPKYPTDDLSELPRPFPVVVALLRQRTGIRMTTQRASFLCEQALEKLRAAFTGEDDPGGKPAYRMNRKRTVRT